MFGVPGGGSSLELIEAGRGCGLPFVLSHLESAACIMAAVTGELTGVPGAALVGLGPGAASAVNGVAYAWLDRAPLVLISDRHSRAVSDFTTHQALDQRALFANLVKASWVIESGAAAAQIAEAIELASAEPRGPVHLELAGDVASSAASGSAGAKRGVRPLHEISGFDRAAERLRSSRRPVLLVGLQCREAEDARGVLDLVNRLGAPLLTTYKAKGILPEEHALHAGIFTGGVIEASIVGAADVIVTIGLDDVELIPKPWAYDVPVIHINREPSSTRYYRPDVTLTGAPGAILQEVSRAMGSDARSEWNPAEVSRLKRAQIDRLSVPTEGLAPHRVAEICSDLAPPSSIAAVDSGAHMFAMAHFWTARSPRSFLISNGLATMGFALPAAVAAQLLHPERRVLCFTGDGGLMMVAAEFETVTRLHLPIVVVVFDDHALSLIQIKQQQKGYHGATSYQGPDFAALAESFGWAAFVALTERELREAFAAALAAEGPALVDARVDASGYRRMLEAIRGAP